MQLLADDLQRLEAVIRRMQEIQHTIKGARQPVTMPQLMEMKSLGNEYARIIERLANDRGATGLA